MHVPLLPPAWQKPELDQNQREVSEVGIVLQLRCIYEGKHIAIERERVGKRGRKSINCFTDNWHVFISKWYRFIMFIDGYIETIDSDIVNALIMVRISSRYVTREDRELSLACKVYESLIDVRRIWNEVQFWRWYSDIYQFWSWICTFPAKQNWQIGLWKFNKS